ncbi:MAG: gamma-glutamyltranspeptidase precursor, partial [Gemmatimonadota bacterium]
MLACRPAVSPPPTAIAAMSGKRAEGAQGMVAASQPDAAAAGVEILRAGGNAADAAVATAFALSVTDISQTGLGGGGALTFYDAAEGRAEHLSFYPRTGADSLWGVQDTTPAGRRAGRAAAVPGMVAGLLETHRRFGVLPLARVMAPAIRLARDGFVVTPLLARTIASSGCTSRSPGRSDSPPGRKRAAAAGSSRSFARELAIVRASSGVTTNPSRASRIAGAITRASGRTPNRRCVSSSPATIPGTAAARPARRPAGVVSCTPQRES